MRWEGIRFGFVGNKDEGGISGMCFSTLLLSPFGSPRRVELVFLFSPVSMLRGRRLIFNWGKMGCLADVLYICVENNIDPCLIYLKKCFFPRDTHSHGVGTAINKGY